MLIRRLRTPLHVAYGQYYLWDSWNTDTPRLSTDGTGVFGIGDGTAAVLVSGVHTGSIDLTVEVYDAEPAVDLDGWDDVAEATMTLPSDEAYVVEWGAGRTHALELPPAAATYRVRVSVRGRDAARAGHDGASEAHLIAMWPAPAGPTVVWRGTDGVGAYWRHVDEHHSGPHAVEFRGEVRRYLAAEP